MIDVHELLKTKENDLVRIRKEIDALRLVAPMLDSESTKPQTEVEAIETRIPVEISTAQQDPPEPEPQLDEASPESIPPKRTFRHWFGRVANE